MLDDTDTGRGEEGDGRGRSGGVGEDVGVEKGDEMVCWGMRMGTMTGFRGWGA